MKVTLLLMLALMWSVCAEAQQKPSLYLLVEDPVGDAARCGITTSSIEAVAAATLRGSGILVAPDNAVPYYLHVSAIVMNVSAADCVISTDVSVNGFTSISPGAIMKKDSPLSTLVLCHKTGLLQISPGKAMAATSQRVGDSIQLCLGELKY